MSARARARVETDYSLRTWGPRFADAIVAAAGAEPSARSRARTAHA